MPFARGLALSALLALVAGTVSAQEGNLVRNPGFEDPADKSWVFTNHDQDFARGDIQAQNYHTGLYAIKTVVAQPPKIYVAWAQQVAVPKPEAIPDEFSIWYQAPTAPAVALIQPLVADAGKVVARESLVVNLPPSNPWAQVTQKLDLPPNTCGVRIELRISQAGEFFFDDVTLVRRNAAFSGPPDRLLFIGLPVRSGEARDALPAPLRDGLAKAGWSRISACEWEALNPALLKQTRLTVVVQLPLRATLSGRDQATIKLLMDYANAGGGLLLGHNRQQVLTDYTIVDALLRRLGTRILLEEFSLPKEQSRLIGKWGADTYAATDAVYPPLADGVKSVLYQSCMAWLCYHGVLPFLPGGEWQVALDAGPLSNTAPKRTGLADVDRDMRSSGFAERVPLLGLRPYGAGRIGYLCLNAPNLFSRPLASKEDTETYSAYLTGEPGGRPSDMLKLLTNLFGWLSAGADHVQQAELKLQPATDVAFRQGWKLNRGVIGPRTVYSTGQSTPDEYVTKAKSLGLDFVIFLEDFAALKDSGFDNLKADCRRLTTADFVAIPGITFENTDGNHEFVFSDSLRLPSPFLLDRTGKRTNVSVNPVTAEGGMVDLQWLYSLLGFESTSGWYRFRDNPYPFDDARDVNAFGLVTQENGTTVERLPEAYGKTSRDGQFLWPVALTLMRSAKELDLMTDGTYYTNVVGAESGERLYQFFTTLHARSSNHKFPGAPPFGTMFATTGPTISMDMPRGDMDAEGDIFNPRLQEWTMKLDVSSPAGLREVRILDGTTCLRRFLPGGQKEFSYTGTFTNERQRALWCQATDMNGREAISRSIVSNSWLLRENQCADRNNQLLDSRQKRPDGSPFFVGYGGDTAMPDKGPWNGRLRPVGCFVFDARLGVGSLAYDGSPEQHPQAAMNPHLLWGDQWPGGKGWLRHLVPEREGAPHVNAHRVVACSDVLIADRVLDGVFPLTAPEVVHVWHSLYPVTPSKILRTTGRTTFYLIKPDGISAYLWEQDVELLQDVPVGTKVPFLFHCGNLAGIQAKRFAYLPADGTDLVEELKPKPVETRVFKPGDALAFLDNPFGSMAAFSLSDNLAVYGDRANYQVGITAPGPVAKAGSKFQARILLVGMHRAVPDPVALAKQVRDQYGLGRPATGYQVKADTGRVTSQDYRLTLAAADNAFRGTVTGLKALAGNLGARVTGLNNQWSACLQLQGEKPQLRFVPVEDGVAYAVLQEALDGQKLFLGHPVVADRPEVVLQMARSKDWQKWTLEIHNPTAAAMTVNVRTHPALTGITFAETITLPAGVSQFRDLGPANSGAQTK